MLQKNEDADGTSPSPNMEHDILKLTIGDFGRWQFKISLLMALLKLPIAWFQLSIVFLAPPTQFWCKPPESRQNLSEGQWIKPLELNREGLNVGYCTIREGNSTISCPNGYNYNTTTFRSTIVSEWDMVCENKRLVELSQITLMLGVLIGNIVFGVMADRRGRKKVLMACITLQATFGIVAALVPWFWAFTLSRFLLALSNGGTMVTSFVMCMEIVGGKWRTIVPILYQIPFGFGNTVMAGISYYLRDWRQFQFALSALSSVYVLYLWCIPESPRWLLAIGRNEEAMFVLQKAAETNKIRVEKIAVVMTHLSNTSQTENQTKFSALFSTTTLRKRSILLCLNWTIAGVTFYAFSQYLGYVSRNLYLTVAFGGLIALPGTILCVFLVGKCGRRWSIACSHLLTSGCFLAILLTPKNYFVHDWPRILFAALGIIGLSVSMPALYLFTGELFPTILRNAGVGTSVMFCRVGSMIAPLIISLEGVAPMLPLLILAVASFVEAMLVLPLPETKGKRLPEVIGDLEIAHRQEPSEMKRGSYVSLHREITT